MVLGKDLFKLNQEEELLRKSQADHEVELSLMREEVSQLRNSNLQLEQLVKTYIMQNKHKPQEIPTPTPAEPMKLVHETPTEEKKEEIKEPMEKERIKTEENDSKSKKEKKEVKLPSLPKNLPPHILSYTSSDSKSTLLSVNKWYRFMDSTNESLPISCWVVRKMGRADDWRLLECNQAFIDLIKIPVAALSSSFSLTQLFPARFKSSNGELLQQIIHVSFFIIISKYTFLALILIL